MALLGAFGAAVLDAGRRLGLGLPPGSKVAFGERDGYLVQLAAGYEGNVECALEVIRYGDATRDAAVRDAVARSPELDGLGIRAKKITIADGVLVHKRARRLFRSLDPATLAADVEALLRAVKQATAPAPARCRVCGSDSGREPVLINNVVDRVCPACLERMQQDAKRASRAYDERPIRAGSMVLVAAGLALVTAAVWAGIAITTNRMFWLVAIGAGALIGWGTAKAAGRGGRAVQAAGVLFTLVSVLLGQVFFIAWQLQQYARQRGLRVDWNWFATHVPQLLWSTGADTLFALGGGLFGALYAARRAARPRIELDVQRNR